MKQSFALSAGHSPIAHGTVLRSVGRWASAVRDHMIALQDKATVWAQRARQRRDLNGLDDHLLHDIGLSRADVYRESLKPFWRD